MAAIPTSVYSGRAETHDPLNVLLLKLWYQVALLAGSIPNSGGGGGATNSGLPYDADEQDITNVVAGPSVIVYKRGGATVKTRNFTYTNGGASSTDVLTKTVDS